MAEIDLSKNQLLSGAVHCFPRLMFCLALVVLGQAESAVADQRLCRNLDSMTSLRSVEELKTNPIAIDSWNTDFNLVGFEACRIYVSTESDPRMASTDVIACDVWTDDMERVRGLRDSTLASLTCGRNAVSVAGFSEDDKNLMFPETGLAVMANVGRQDLDFTLWRRDLRDDDPRTERDIYRLTISIAAFFPRQ